MSIAKARSTPTDELLWLGQQGPQATRRPGLSGLLRQYMPKGTDLSVHSAEDLARFAASLNNPPRESLGFMKPSEKLVELVAMTG